MVLARRHDPITCAPEPPLPRNAARPVSRTGGARWSARSPALKGWFVAGHRSPRGRRAYASSGPVSATQLIARSNAPAGPRLRTSVLASAAAVGAVATGTFSTLVPALSDATPTASADEAHLSTALAASTTTLPTVDAPSASAALVPVTYGIAGEGFAAADTHLAMLGKGADLAKQAADRLAAEQAKQ